MLTRTSGGVTTTFLWDGWDCIRESTPTSTTHYLIPEGQLLGFRRDGEQYSVASDALGCVRLVTDSSGDVVFRRDYGAWGETLPGGFDNVPGGMPYCFVGGLGVRTDADTGMHYMRQRWYDPLLQRFISRDPIGLEGGKNLYEYCGGNPIRFNDPMGLDWVDEHLDEIEEAAKRRNIPPEVLCATILTEMRRLPRGREQLIQSWYNLAGWHKRYNEFVLAGYPHLESERRAYLDTSAGPLQIKPSSLNPDLDYLDAGVEWNKLNSDTEYALDQGALYLSMLHNQVLKARSRQQGPDPDVDDVWTRTISAYNTGKPGAANGRWHPKTYGRGDYAKAIAYRILLCREKFKCKRSKR